MDFMLVGTYVEEEMKKYKYETATVTLPNGKRKYVRGKTKEELREKMHLLKQELCLGIDVGNETTVREYTNHWFRTTRTQGLSDRSAFKMERLLENYIYPVIGPMKIRDVKPAHIRTIVSNISQRSRGTQACVIRLLRDSFNLAVEDNIITRSPVSPGLKAHGDTPEEVEALTPEQEKALLEAAKGTMAYTAVLTILYTGLRRGEFTALMWSDIDYDAHVIHVRRHVIPQRDGSPIIASGAKTEAGVRDVPLPDILAAHLRERQKSTRSVYVFPNSKGQLYSPSAFSSLWKTLDKRAGFHTHPHQLRHTYATKLFEMGLDIKQIQYVMGHSSPNITLDTYTHFREDLRKASTVQQVCAALC